MSSSRAQPIPDEKEQRADRERQQYRLEMAAWLAEKHWSYFVTLTFKPPPGPESMRQPPPPPRSPAVVTKRVKAYIRSVGRRARKRVPHFVTLEHHADGESLHVHLLIAGTAQYQAKELEALWPWGFARAERIDDEPETRAAYVSKTVENRSD